MYQYDGTDVTFPANSDLSTYQFCAMTLTSGKATPQTSNNGVIVGILQNKPDAANQAAVIRVTGVSLVKMNELVAAMKHVTVANAAGGKLEVVDAANELAVGLILEASGAADDLVPMLLDSCYVIASEA